MSTEAGWGKGSHGRNGFCSSGHTEPWSGSEQTGQGELEVMDEDLEVLDWYFRMVPGWFRAQQEQTLARYPHPYLQLLCFARLALKRKQRRVKKKTKGGENKQEERGGAWKR